MPRPVALLIGHGPGLGSALARAFTADYDLALVSRSAHAPPADLPDGTRSLALAADAAQPAELEAAIARTEAELGPVDCLLYNASARAFGTLEEVDAALFETAWRVAALGLFSAVQAVVPGMTARGRGTILVSGATAAHRGVPFTTAFAPAKAAQRILAQSLAKQLGPKGIHVATVTIDGVMESDRARKMFPERTSEDFLQADRVAEAALMLARQDKSAWTFDMDLRPAGERW